MAVAVKTSPGAKKDAPPADPAVQSLAGVVYLIACLALLFQVIPGFFWPAWQAAGLGKYAFQGGAVLVLLVAAAGAVCLWVGGKLLGTNAPPGVRAGVFTALVGLLAVALLARWASLWIEHWAYNGLFSPSTGAIATIIVAAGLLFLFLRMFLGQGMRENMVWFEEAGWFHATTYKGNQGQVVRRATIFALLLVAAAGIYTLLSHNTLRRYGPDWAIPIPFTGTVALEGYGDAADLVANDAIVPDPAKSAVEIRLPGATSYAAGRVIGLEAYKGAVEQVLKDSKDAEFLAKHGPDLTKAMGKDGSAYVREVNRIVHERFLAWLDRPIGERLISEDTTRRLRGIDQESDDDDLTRLIAAFKREVALAAGRRIRVTDPGASELPSLKKGSIALIDEFNSEAARLKKEGKKEPAGEKVGQLGPAFDLPLAALRVDRFALQAVEKKLDPAKNVYVTDPGDTAAAFKG
ncbi:MAG: hypothetical protein K2W96_07485, partial [Gemmataceae bacterium]|nr:hypothetical protein [Gemmataceae bacterium]